MTETFYDVLGVSSEATAEEIESAYRAAIKEVHPDVSDASDASQRTKRLNKAKKVLTDDEERARYDRVGHVAYTDDSPGAQGTDERTDSTDDSEEDSANADRTRGSRRKRRRGESGRRSGRRNDEGGPMGSAGSATGGSSSSRQGDPGTRAGTDASGATRSRTDSRGPSWQSGSVGAGGSRSARRQAAASGPDGPNVDWSWNAWDPRDAWAVRQGDRSRGLHPARLFPADQSLVLIASSIFCYPFFVGSVVFPSFPLVARLVVLLCTLFMFAYLLSIPEVAILVYGFWSVVGTLGLLLWPAVGVVSLVGVILVTATWVPLGISLLTFRILRP
jgi:curved DNA-binding protein CbpA